MKKPTIISMVKINDVWVRQEDAPPDVVHEMVMQTIAHAAANIGFDAIKKEKVI